MPIPFINLLNDRRRKMSLLARIGIAAHVWTPTVEEEETPVVGAAVIEVPDRDTEIARLEIRLRELGIDRSDSEAVA